MKLKNLKQVCIVDSTITMMTSMLNTVLLIILNTWKTIDRKRLTVHLE